MLSLEGYLALCELSEDEVLAIAHHEHLPEIAAAELGNYLCHTPEGEMRIKAIIRDDIAEARAGGDRMRELALKMMLRSILQHPRCEERHSRQLTTWSAGMGAPGVELGLALAGAAPEQEDLDPAALIAPRDRPLTRAHAARATFGISPALALAFGDWALHLAASPGKAGRAAAQAARKLLRYGTWWSQAVQGKPCANCIEPLEQDTRFRARRGNGRSTRSTRASFLAAVVAQRDHGRARRLGTHGTLCFTVRQLLDIVSPSNFPGAIRR